MCLIEPARITISAFLNALMLRRSMTSRQLRERSGKSDSLRFFSGSFRCARAHIRTAYEGIFMEVAARSRLLAGAAIIGAGALVAAPIQPVPDVIAAPVIQSATPAVEMTALVNPIELWSAVISQAIANTGAIANTVLENPIPIAHKVIDNQLITADVLTSFVALFGEGFVASAGGVPAALQSAVEQILAGEIYSGVENYAIAILTPVVEGALGALGQLDDISAVLQNPFLNAANVVGTVVSVPTLIGAGLPILFEALSPILQVGLTAQGVYDGVTAGDLEAVANALISFPSDMAGTILNGNPTIGNSGLLGSELGLIPSLLTVRQSIADAIQPPAVSTLVGAKMESAPEVNSFTFTVDEDGELGEVTKSTTESGTTEGNGIQAIAAKSADAEDDATTGTGTETEPEKSEKPVVKSKKPLVTLGNKFSPTTTAGDKARPGQRAEAALKSIGDEVNKTVKKIGDGVKKALGVKGKKKADSKASSSSKDSAGSED
ncbi:hypothetical protein NLB33_29390 [Mycolicibacterium smegmatis]|uniref:hypothetical protein n=1 Tax=Mycolicibacterium smegmatis TaxID=1772 RepID=UPI0020A2C69C|nr:hypothetical protein [Mycolicibacterium smegmatis]MCP2626962.1 hypothetical protein [Mycolicibacterium smegmatis]